MIDWIVGTVSFLWFGFWGLWLTWPALLVLFGWGIWGELDDGLTVNVISTVALSYVFWQIFDIPALTIPLSLIGFENWSVGAHWVYAVLFLPIGFIWSFRRYKIFCIKYVMNTKSTDRDDVRNELEIKNNLDKVLSWVLSWPVGMVSRLFEDIIFTIKDIALTICKGIYNRILEKALSLLPEPPKKNDTITGFTRRNY